MLGVLTLSRLDASEHKHTSGSVSSRTDQDNDDANKYSYHSVVELKIVVIKIEFFGWDPSCTANQSVRLDDMNFLHQPTKTIGVPKKGQVNFLNK